MIEGFYKLDFMKRGLFGSIGAAIKP